MASGDVLFTLWARDAIPTATNGAVHGIISDASTPTSGTPVLAYDGGAADEHADWQIVLPTNYAGTTGFTWKVHYTTAGTSTGAVEFEIRALKLTDNSSDLNGADLGIDTQTATTIADTPGGTLGVFNVTTTGTMAKANAGTPAAGDQLIVRVSRDYDYASNTDDAQLICAICTET